MCKENNTPPSPPQAEPSDAQAFDSDSTPCLATNLHVQVCDEATGQPLDGVAVTVAGQGTKTTNAEGWAKWRPITAGSYDVSARKDLHSPDPAARPAVVAPQGQTTETELRIQPVDLHLHLDADRDGNVDDDWRHNRPWTPGAGQHGAIVLFNNDNDDRDPAKERDFENRVVDTTHDLSDLAPLHIRRDPPGVALPATITATLSVSDRNRLRILRPATAAGIEVVGPTQAQLDLDHPTLAADADLPLRIEALQYPEKSFNGLLTISLAIKVNGNLVRTETAEVRVAPWILFNHAHRTEKVYIVDTGDNATLRGEIDAVVTNAGATMRTAAGATYNRDRWMQDGMEPGFAAMPRVGGGNPNTPATLRTAKDRGTSRIDAYPKGELLDRDYGFHQALPPTSAGNSLDSFGNLECSPPFTHSGAHGEPAHDYPFGRVIYGDDTKGNGAPRRQMHPRVRRLLAAQVVQAPIAIDSNWLVVGHVDEFISFLPGAGGSHGWKVLIASPALALQIVAAQDDATPLFVGIDMNQPNPFSSGGLLRDLFPLRTCGEIKGSGGATFRTWQAEAQAVIDAVRTTELKVKLDLQDSDFIHLPVLFSKTGSRYIAYTAGSVNMLVVTTGGKPQLCIPKPFGPRTPAGCRFEADIRTKLAPHAGVHFIDCFLTYHVGQGEIHCGTNSQRTPPDERWWELTWI